jgi:isopenicillin-N N-acyltransferase-like protein
MSDVGASVEPVIPIHYSAEEDPWARGFEFGRRQALRVQATVDLYGRLFRRQYDPTEIDTFGRSIAASLERDWPALSAEIAGLAAGAGVGSSALHAVNARTELLSGDVGECSVVGVLPERSGGSLILAQNWDWYAEAMASLTVWVVVEPSGHWWATLTEAGLLAKIGLNASGVGVCLNLLSSQSDSGDVAGTPIHVLLRLILQRCESLLEVDQLLHSTAVSASSCLSAGCADGLGSALASFELSPGNVDQLGPTNGVLLHTNHFLGPLGSTADDGLERWPDSESRLDELRSRFVQGEDAVTTRDVKKALASHAGDLHAVCSHSPAATNDQETLASIAMAPGDKRIELSDGAPCRAPYRPVRLAGQQEPWSAG